MACVGHMAQRHLCVFAASRAAWLCSTQIANRHHERGNPHPQALRNGTAHAAVSDKLPLGPALRRVRGTYHATSARAERAYRVFPQKEPGGEPERGRVLAPHLRPTLPCASSALCVRTLHAGAPHARARQAHSRSCKQDRQLPRALVHRRGPTDLVLWGRGGRVAQHSGQTRGIFSYFYYIHP